MNALGLSDIGKGSISYFFWK